MNIKGFLRNNVEWVISILLVLVFLFSVSYFRPLGAQIDDATGFIVTITEAAAGIFAITTSVTFVALQLSSQTYTPRLIQFYITRWYFLAMILLYPITLLYSVVILRCADDSCPQSLDLLLVLFFFDVVLLVPYTVLFFRELDPAHSKVLKYLCGEISLRKIAGKMRKERIVLQTEEEYEMTNLFEPINEVVVAAITRYDFETTRKCVWEIGSLYTDIVSNMNSPQKWPTFKSLPRGESISLYFEENAFDKYVAYALKEMSEDVLIEIAKTLEQMLRGALNGNQRVQSTDDADYRNALDLEVVNLVDLLGNLVKVAIQHNFESAMKRGILALQRAHLVSEPYELRAVGEANRMLKEVKQTASEGGFADIAELINS